MSDNTKQAFPIETHHSDKYNRWTKHVPGLTLREYAAVHIMCGSVASDIEGYRWTDEEHAEVAVRCADALVRELGKQNE